MSLIFGRLRRLVVVARVWGVVAVALAAGVELVVCFALPHPVGIPGRGEITELVWPIAPAIPCLLLAAYASRQWSPRERCGRRSPARRRLLLLVATGLVLASAIALMSRRYPVTILVRNTALLEGSGLLAIMTLPEAANWVPTATIALGCWFLGPTAAGGAPARWALLLQPAGDTLARNLSLGLWVTAVAAYVTGFHPRRTT